MMVSSDDRSTQNIKNSVEVNSDEEGGGCTYIRGNIIGEALELSYQLT